MKIKLNFETNAKLTHLVVPTDRSQVLVVLIPYHFERVGSRVGQSGDRIEITSRATGHGAHVPFSRTLTFVLLQDTVYNGKMNNRG